MVRTMRYSTFILNVPFLNVYVFLYLIVIILIEENRKKLTLCQNNKKLTKFKSNVESVGGNRRGRGPFRACV